MVLRLHSHTVQTPMASRPGLLYNWPWRNDYTKYLLVLSPFVGACLLGKDDDDDWCFHMACLALLRLLHGQLWVIFGRSSLYDKWGIYSSRPDYKQVHYVSKDSGVPFHPGAHPSFCFCRFSAFLPC